jgi:hypothetical protein
MRIDSVTAHCFGPLTGDSLELAPGMTVVVGDNESAKSSWHAAIYSALCGRARRKGRLGQEEQWFMDRHKPWDTSGWAVSARLTLDDGRQIEMRQDLADNVHCSATDLQLARDVSNEIMEDGSPDAAAWLGLDRRSFVATACINQAQLLGVLGEAEGMQKILQRATATAGADATAAEALALLDTFQRSQVGRDDARSTRPLRQAILELERARRALERARVDHDDYLRGVEHLEQLRAAAVSAQRELLLHEAAAARELADGYGDRCARASELRLRLGDTPPSQETQADALATQVARALEAWDNRPERADLSGPTSEELRADVASLPEVPPGDLAVDPGVQAAYDAVVLAGQRLTAQEQARPVVPETDLPGVAPDELLTLAHALEVGSGDAGRIDTSRLDEVGVRVGQLEAAGRRGRLLTIVGFVVVVVGIALAVLGPPALGALAVAGIGMIIAGQVTSKRGALRDARAKHVEASIQMAGAKEAGARFAQERTRAEQRCAEIGVPAAPAQLRTLASQIAEHATFAQRGRLFDEQRRTLTSEREDAERTLRDALVARGVRVHTDLAAALAAYTDACQQRAQVAGRAARRPTLELQLQQRLSAEAMAADRIAARVAAEHQVHDALVACGLGATSAAEAVAALEKWEHQRQAELREIDQSRAEWSELDTLLGGRTFIELTEAYQGAATDAERRRVGLDAGEIAALAAGNPTAHLGELRQRASEAGEEAASADGAFGAQVKDLPSVSEAEEAVDAAVERLDWLRDLDSVLSTTQRFLADAQERVQRDLAPVLAAALTAWLPRITAGRYCEAIINIETLEVQVCGSERRWRSAKRLSQGTAEQVYLLLRAALARQLTAGKESCPLLLDDVTVQSDEGRTDATLDLLHELSTEQQVIVFAQERGVAEWARSHLCGPQDAIVALPVVGGT